MGEEEWKRMEKLMEEYKKKEKGYIQREIKLSEKEIKGD